MQQYLVHPLKVLPPCAFEVLGKSWPDQNFSIAFVSLFMQHISDQTFHQLAGSLHQIYKILCKEFGYCGALKDQNILVFGGDAKWMRFRRRGKSSMSVLHLYRRNLPVINTA